jgi:DNA-binding transcriptional MerR regulator
MNDEDTPQQLTLTSPTMVPVEVDDEAALPDKLFFRIGEAAELVGVEPHVLRYWETEFKIRPQRSTAGQRMYRRKDIARFLRIRRLLHDEGFTIAGARKLLLEGLGDVGGPQAAPGADVVRVEEALGRVTELRTRIAALRARIARTGVGGN